MCACGSGNGAALGAASGRCAEVVSADPAMAGQKAMAVEISDAESPEGPERGNGGDVPERKSHERARNEAGPERQMITIHANAQDTE